jgi:hypothetical protein
MENGSSTGLFALTELEGKLRGPGGKALQEAFAARFDCIIRDLHDYIASGPDPAGYAGAEAMLKAIAAAREVVINIPSSVPA